MASASMGHIILGKELVSADTSIPTSSYTFANICPLFTKCYALICTDPCSSRTGKYTQNRSRINGWDIDLNTASLKYIQKAYSHVS